jgi:hypothetical protein
MATLPLGDRISCTIDEACRATGIGRIKLLTEISAGRVQTKKVGAETLIIVESLPEISYPDSYPPERAGARANRGNPMTSAIPFRERISCTIQEACAATGIGRTKLYAEISAGRVHTKKVGTRTLIIVESLVAMIDPNASSQRAA